MNKFLFLFLFVFLVSCAHDARDDMRQIPQTVSINQNKNRVELDTSAIENDLYGPEASTSSTKNQNIQTEFKTPVIALDLSPSLYGAFNYIALLSSLEKQTIPIHVINTTGFTAVIACLYAKYKNANKVEWKIFTLVNTLKDVAPYSAKWYDLIEKYLNQEFHNQKVEEFDIVISISQGKNNSIITRGKITEVLMQSVKIEHSKSFIKMPHFDYLEEVKKLGVDIVIELNALPRQLKFKRPNDYLLGIYARLNSAYYSREASIALNSSIEYIDTIPNLSDLMLTAKNSQKEAIENIENIVQGWKDKNN
jgi:hypothetical protein